MTGHTMHVKSSVLDYDTVIGDALHIQKILLIKRCEIHAAGRRDHDPAPGKKAG